MQTVKVKKSDLLDKLETNRKSHRELFLKAQEGFRQMFIERLDDMLKKARENKQYDLYVGLKMPVDQTEDYDLAIAMCKMSVEDVISLSQREFSNYVLDNWDWKQDFTVSNSMYFAKADSR